jgi:hypothetical protein
MPVADRSARHTAAVERPGCRVAILFEAGVLRPTMDPPRREVMCGGEGSVAARRCLRGQVSVGHRRSRLLRAARPAPLADP